MSMLNSILNDPIILPAGSAVMATHILLTLLFKYVCPPGPWKTLPSFTAHQVVALAMMIFHTYLGFVYFQEMGMLAPNEGGMFLARFSMGSMMLWDIPVGFMSDGMGDPIMQIHHIGFFIVASITLGYFSNGTPVGAAYAPFFFGVVELSSIPLSVVDVFHPKQKAWHDYLSQSKTLQSMNELSRVAFALLYVGTRVIYFPYVVFGHVVPDCLQLPSDHPELAFPLRLLLVLAVLFTLLQLYWGFLIIRQIVKALTGGGKGDSKKKKE